MSLSKVMPSSAESKSGKIYANSEQRKTLMAVYLADNYPDTSTLEQVAISIRVRLEKRPFSRLFQKMYFFVAGFQRAGLQPGLGAAMVHVHQVRINQTKRKQRNKNKQRNTNKQRNKNEQRHQTTIEFLRKVMRKQGKEPVQANRPDKVSKFICCWFCCQLCIKYTCI